MVSRGSNTLQRFLNILVLLLPVWAQSQPFYNLDFEVATRNRLRGWGIGVSGYELAMDPAQFTSGAYSVRIRNTGAPDAGLAPASRTLPIELVRGKRVTISGSMRTENVNPG
jgi:hypothetical protein